MTLEAPHEPVWRCSTDCTIPGHPHAVVNNKNTHSKRSDKFDSLSNRAYNIVPAVPSDMKFIMIYETRFALLVRDGFSVYMDIQSTAQNGKRKSFSIMFDSVTWYWYNIECDGGERKSIKILHLPTIVHYASSVYQLCLLKAFDNSILYGGGVGMTMAVDHVHRPRMWTCFNWSLFVSQSRCSFFRRCLALHYLMSCTCVSHDHISLHFFKDFVQTKYEKLLRGQDSVHSFRGLPY